MYYRNIIIKLQEQGELKMKTVYTINEIIDLAKERFEITDGREVGEYNQKSTDIKKTLREQIRRKLEKLEKEGGIQLVHSNPNHKAKDKRVVLAETVDKLLHYDLKDYFCSHSDNAEILAGLDKRKKLEKKARKSEENYRQYLESGDYEKDMRALLEDNHIGYPDYKLTGYDGDRIYRHMIEKMFEVDFTPFDFELYASDREASILFDPQDIDVDLIESKERYGDLTNYYGKKDENLIDRIADKVVEKLMPLISNNTEEARLDETEESKPDANEKKQTYYGTFGENT